MHATTCRSALTAAIMIAACPIPVPAASSVDTLERKLEEMQRQILQLQQEIQEQKQNAKDIDALEKKMAESDRRSEPRIRDSIVHLAGYGSVGYTDGDNTDGRFSQVQFSPIFHYMYKDLVMLESELEIVNSPDGETETNLEYMAVDLFLHDNVALVAGKFLSPIGQFRQNLHPGWINRIPSAPSGFGHDGAAPLSETGVQLRGGIPLGAMKANYALYVGNGPELIAVDEDGDSIADEIESIESEGRTRDVDGDKVWGARIGLLPMPGLEVAVSAATGKALITSVVNEDEETIAGADLSSETGRDYDVLGFDFSWQWNNLDLRGEYVRSETGNASGSAIDGAVWKTWYTQAAYRFRPTPLEGVLRYTDFQSPHASESQEQWAVGMNYLFGPNVIGKLAYEFNDNETGSGADDDNLLVQLSYGF